MLAKVTKVLKDELVPDFVMTGFNWARKPFEWAGFVSKPKDLNKEAEKAAQESVEFETDSLFEMAERNAEKKREFTVDWDFSEFEDCFEDHEYLKEYISMADRQLEDWDEVSITNHLHNGDKVFAIKSLKDLTGLDLKNSKSIIEEYVSSESD